MLFLLFHHFHHQPGSKLVLSPPPGKWQLQSKLFSPKIPDLNNLKKKHAKFSTDYQDSHRYCCALCLDFANARCWLSTSKRPEPTKQETTTTPRQKFCKNWRWCDGWAFISVFQSNWYVFLSYYFFPIEILVSKHINYIGSFFASSSSVLVIVIYYHSNVVMLYVHMNTPICCRRNLQ